MQSIKEVLSSPYRGSEKTCEMVREQVRERWGNELADEFNPHTDAMPLFSWTAYGYRVRRGEKALTSVTFVEKKNEAGEVISKIRRSVNLFHHCQVLKVN